MKIRSIIGLVLLAILLIAIGANGIRIHDYAITAVSWTLVPIVIGAEIRKHV